MRLQDALDSFLLQLEADGRSPHTLGQYGRQIRRLGQWLAGEGRDDKLDGVTPEVLARFLVSSSARVTSLGATRRPVTVNMTRTALRTFFRFAFDADLIPTNPARRVRLAITSPPPPKTLSDAEQARLMDTLLVAQGSIARRDHMLFALMLATGIRIGSALALEKRDVDLARGELRVRCMKRGGEQRVFLSAAIRDHLVGYLAERSDGPLFEGRGRKAMSARQAQARLNAWARVAGIGRAVSPHALRHSFATRVYKATRDVLLVQRALGHRSIQSSLAYVRVSDDELRTAVSG